MVDQNSLKAAVQAIKAGDRQTGGRILTRILKQDPQNELAWLWFSQCQTDPAKKRYCLSKALSINPNNRVAQQELKKLDIPARGKWLEQLSGIQRGILLIGLILVLSLLCVGGAILYGRIPLPSSPATVLPSDTPTATLPQMPVTQMPETQIPSTQTPEQTLTPTSPATLALTDTPVVTLTVPPTESLTPTVAATFTPSTTPTMAYGRPGPLASASHFASPPTIDGTWVEWPKNEMPVPYLVFGEAEWSGPKDLSASYKVGWDAQRLYVAVKVRDDHYIQNTNGKFLYKGDSMELLLDRDLKGDFDQKVLSSDDYRIGISPGNGAINGSREAYLWNPKDKAGNVFARITAMTDAPGTYRLEFALAWSIFDITPVKGAVYGFGFSVSDNDDFHQNVQQSVISTLQHRQVADPTTWGTLILK